MTKFYNPYNFVPLKRDLDGARLTKNKDILFSQPRKEVTENDSQAPDSLPFAKACEQNNDIAKGNTHIRHDAWLNCLPGSNEPLFSGKIIAQLVTKSPTIVGNKHDKNKQITNNNKQGQGRRGTKENTATTVNAYKYKEETTLPGSALRGMISTITEILSQSNMRVLTNQPYSARAARQPPEPIGSSHQYFGGFLPFGAAPNASTLSVAEQMFGVVEQTQTILASQDVEPRKTGDTQKRCLASRIKVSDAVSLGAVKMYNESDSAKLLLNILSGPKAPSPAMYFKGAARQKYLSKGEMSNRHKQGEHLECVPNGWKRYLPRGDIKEPDWVEQQANSERQDLRMQANPMAAGNTFYFPIEFDNLTKPELTLLLYAISPQPHFKHRLGLGKPLGLGMVELAVERLMIIDRSSRYSVSALCEEQGTPTPRYSEVYSGSSANPSSELEAQFPLEYNTRAPEKPLSDWYNEEQLGSEHSLIDKSSLSILRKLGDEKMLNPNFGVHYPRSTNEPGEQKSFKWFVDNQNPAKQQFLPAVSANENDELPPLSFT
ncbi:hypothetical protein [Teredinibacter turnerae]|uniref:hypothetical protein n=1 Tax=Teredinibacter turnerae TaxID=2426 RepID=UPI0003709CBC|nr:hypothetical protein [Teredinibacter turnerae]